MHLSISGFQRQILIAAALYLGQIIPGFNVSWTGPIFPKLRDPNQTPLPEIPTEAQISLIASLIFVGNLPGPYFTGWLSNVKGRKICLILAGLISCVAQAVLTFSYNLNMLYVGRVLTGLSSGMISVMSATYLGEVASTHIRGMVLAGSIIFSTIGVVIMYSVAPFVTYTAATSLILAASIAFTLCTLLIPESPIFYVIIGDEHQVREHLKYIGREDEIDKILESKEKTNKSSSIRDWIELVKMRSNRKALLITFVLNVAQQCSGFFSVLAFSGTIFELAGSSISSDIAMVIVSIFQLLGCTGSLFLIERVGRKTLLIISCLISFISMLLLAVYFYLDSTDYAGLSYVKWLPLVLVIVFFIGFNIGLAGIPSVLLGELFNLNVRTKGSAVAMTCSWVIGFVVMTAYGVVPEMHLAYWFFAGSCLVTLIFTIIFVRETKGKTLLEIQELLN